MPIQYPTYAAGFRAIEQHEDVNLIQLGRKDIEHPRNKRLLLVCSLLLPKTNLSFYRFWNSLI